MRTNLKLSWFTALCFCAITILSTPAKASLIGSTVDWQSYFGGGPTGAGTFGSFVANGSIGGIYKINGANGEAIFGIDVSASSITFDYSVDVFGSTFWNSSVLSLAPTIYNGIALDFTGDSISSLSIDPATNMAGFNGSDISFTSNQIEVNWENLSYTPSTIVELDVNNAVPEPSTNVFVGSGIVALVLWRRRKSWATKVGG